ncbi:GDSL-type esterase/lipase family protein [Weizmannia coagulans]|jgi:lysophospholipase L1-like esterase|uniref:GDSL family lipase n=2 Tax=Heyndrickxia TaxID=2837504 RepID=A0A0C5C5C5_HEYCO|nr:MULTISPECIES: GDSL-type esterase/lipase family protein [Heyndrickxia]AJO21834.1 GDSL family lipase [Heyndrickxia coagulans]AKN52548.1 Lipase/Acylhydrolase with GDSL-like motif [Heyndrickxia coagulans]ATW82301.1 GDSL family lipase [Heyndrickxia coagulans]AVD57038.1 GDSL family lipase [Heyndrickxia coagulans]KGB29141.1 GDSL family lipase [Heyndrickxia coagulans]
MKKHLISAISIVSAVSALLFLAGLWMVFEDQQTKATGVKTETARTGNNTSKAGGTKQITITAIGDSLTRGTGDTAGKGYAGDAADRLKKKTKKAVLLQNNGIKGLTSSGLLEQLKQPQIKRELKSADIILLTIGGNDLFAGGEALDHLNTAYIEKLEKPYLANLKQIYAGIRAVNKTAIVYHVGLYNPFIDLSEAKTTSAIVRKWNFDSASVASDFPKVIYVPTFDLFEQNVNDYLYSDKFHPNTAGYQLIGERVASLIHYREEKAK